MATVQEYPDYDLLSKKCRVLLQEKEIRFAGFVDQMGNLIVGGFKEGTPSLENEVERQNMCMKIASRTSSRMDFDHSLGIVEYTASRRKNAVMMSFPLGTNILLISAKVSVEIETLAGRIMKIIHMT